MKFLIFFWTGCSESLLVLCVCTNILFWKCNFSINHYFRLLVGWLAIRPVSQLVKKKVPSTFNGICSLYSNIYLKLAEHHFITYNLQCMYVCIDYYLYS